MRSNRYAYGNKGSSAIITPRTIIISLVLIALLLFLYNISLYSEKVCDDMKIRLQRAEEEKTQLNSQILEIQKKVVDDNGATEDYLEEIKVLKSEVNSKTDLISSLQSKIELYKKQIDEQKNTINNIDQSEEPKSSKPPKSIKPKIDKTTEVDKIPVIIFAYNRADYLKRTLNNILKYATEEFPIFVSQDGHDQDVTNVIQSFKEVTHLHHTQRKTPQKIFSQSENEVYYFISQHYEFGLRNIFEDHKFSSVIILEDDIEVSPDFFSYFRNTKRLLEEDPTLFCVSAWNDNGREGLVTDPLQLYRTNFFGGLGWMMLRSFWDELSDKWPRAYWDDWLREPPQRMNRDCIRPEISRTYTFGERGSSGGQFYNQFLRTIQLNKEDIDWDNEDINYLKKDNFDPMFEEWLEQAKENRIRTKDDAKEFKDSKLSMYYSNEHDFASKARNFNLMEELT